MNDHEAMEAINQVIDEYCDGELREVTALSRIARVVGLNAISHREAKDVQ